MNDHLSSLIVADKIKRLSIRGRIAHLARISLQPTGFTSWTCYHAQL